MRGGCVQSYGTAIQALLADNTFDWMNCCDDPAGCANGTVAPHGQMCGTHHMSCHWIARKRFRLVLYFCCYCRRSHGVYPFLLSIR